MKELKFYANIQVSGTIEYLKPLTRDDGLLGGSVGIRTYTKRKGFILQHKSFVKGFLMKKDWEYLMNKNAQKYDCLAVEGHIEEWENRRGDPKQINVFEKIVFFEKSNESVNGE